MIDISSCRHIVGVGDILMDELKINLGRFARIKYVEDIDKDGNSDVEKGFEELEPYKP